MVFWSEGNWKSVDAWLEQIEQNIVGLKARVKRGGDFDRWDIQTRNGLFDAFSRSTAFGPMEHNALIDALASS